jgi:glycosyltransferase involved in cell wall biosynthesis
MTSVNYHEHQPQRSRTLARPRLVASAAAADRAEGAKPSLRIAVFLESPPDSGGGFQQAFSTVESLTKGRATSHEFVVFTPYERSRRRLLEYGVEAVRYRHRPFNLLDRWSATVVGNAVFRRLRRLGFRRLGRHMDALLDDHRIDIAFFNDVGDGAWCIGDHPIIVTVWDIDHRDHPYLPEVFQHRLFERRERNLGVTLMRALAVIANSPSGARRIAEQFQVDSSRILELPFLPAAAVRRHAAGQGTMTAEAVRRKYGLADRYVFYPVYFSASKNHLYLLEGLIALERRHGIVLQAVFCGGGETIDLERVKLQVRALGLDERTHFLGLVPDEDIPALYEGAFAMVMPTFTGPTNLPPLEAVMLGCPVVYSDLPGCREQMGEAALYCDLRDPSSLADHLAELIRDPSLRDRLRAAGEKRATEIAQIDYGERLAPILDDFADIRRRWAWPE